MTPHEFLTALSNDEPSVIQMPRLPISIDKADIAAAKLLLWLYENNPDMTQGEVQDTLDAAKWWDTYFGSANLAQRRLAK